MKRLTIGLLVAILMVLSTEGAHAFCLWGFDCLDCDWGWVNWC